ncbi:MAG: AAA family ATPase [Pseudomonadota bacterium]|nr:AAA family ATPase [Pseudomonadota bacterium]MDP1904038.1 AAA family ATPase [Pseudomonadota bacterium]MDP2352110.1 AAA family ATPase [Pseudomonadota bacterium]
MFLDTALFRRPILLNPTLLKCALLAVALPQAFIETADYPARAELDAEMARLRHRSDNKNALQELLERGGWHHLVSVGFRCRLQQRGWSPVLRETAHDWLLCAGEVIAESHPSEARRLLFFDLKEPFSGRGLDTLIPNDELSIRNTHGEALWSLLSGGADVPPFELFTKLVELHQAGLFEDVELRLRRDDKPEAGAGPEARGRDIGVLRYEELSDGEQMVLGRMALFHLLAGQQDALLLLDEPETHFNDRWKREIVDIIDEAIGHTANDVLISTHSAIVLSDVFNDEIVMVEKTADGSGVRSVDQQTFATDPSALMMSVFEADDSIGKRAQEFIEGKLRQAQGSAEDIRQLEQLIARMGSGFYRSELRTLLNTWRAGNA